MNRSAYVLSVAVTLFALLNQSPAQVPTGTPRFGSFGGGPFDVVNLGNLNAHFDIKVRTKAGRVTPFTYDITYDTSIWYPTPVNGVQTWQPVASYGWYVPLAGTGSITNQIIHQDQEPCNPPNDMTMITHIVYAFYVFTDPRGQTHPYNTAFNWYSNDSCPMAQPSGSTSSATDGSGYVLTLANWTGAQTVVGANGMTYLGNGT
ncbi:MAG: hypothetical protein ACLQBK_16210, partial [Candidatus Sulfotelmatobacter sp.]